MTPPDPEDPEIQASELSGDGTNSVKARPWPILVDWRETGTIFVVQTILFAIAFAVNFAVPFIIALIACVLACRALCILSIKDSVALRFSKLFLKAQLWLLCACAVFALVAFTTCAGAYLISG